MGTAVDTVTGAVPDVRPELLTVRVALCAVASPKYTVVDSAPALIVAVVIFVDVPLAAVKKPLPELARVTVVLANGVTALPNWS